MAITPNDDPEDRRIAVAELILRLRRNGVTEKKVLDAIEAVPRDVFVPPESQDRSYSERALAIDCGQTISAPLIVGTMTTALDLDAHDRVLEIGTGSGYQTAVLAELCQHVYTIDRFRTLVAAAESRFRTLRLSNVTTLVGDGTKGWPEQAPFDKIIVTAAAEAVPEALLKQVRLGGIIVAPIGPLDGVQKLLKLTRTVDGFLEKVLMDVRFVPLIPGKAAQL